SFVIVLSSPHSLFYVEVQMAVYVVIKRKFKMNHPEKLLPLLSELSERAKTQPGYLSTETLQSTENPEDYLVISKWENGQDWQAWFASKERRDIQGRVDSLIGERTFYEIFEPVS
ncbi:MAG: antibiotic biosynthesis monooxygenase family protein, partial [Desulforhopalus sp.]